MLEFLMMRAQALLNQDPHATDESIRTALQPHLCRCGTHMRILRAVRRAAEEMKPKSADAYTRDRLTDLLEFFELAHTAYEQLENLPTPALVRLARMGDKALRLLGVTKR